VFALTEPVDLAIDESRDVLYATSKETQEVYVLDASTGRMIGIRGGKGSEPGRFLAPMGIALDAEGSLYVVDRMKLTVSIFSATGAFVKEFPVKVPLPQKLDAMPRLFGIALRPKKGELYISDIELKRIWVFDEDGMFLRFVGQPNDEREQLFNFDAYAGYLQFDPEGNLVVFDREKWRISTYEPENGKRLYSWVVNRRGASGFDFVGGFAYDKEGNILVVEKSSAKVRGFLRDGRYLFELSDERGNERISIFSPKTVAVDSKNRVFVCEGLVNRIQAFQIIGPDVPPQR
jgi:hypothetical protein